MRRVDLAWLLLAVSATLLYAVQGALVRAPVIGAWIPDAGLVIVLALAARAPGGRALLAAVAVGSGRAAVSIDPASAVLAGYIAAAAVTLALRAVLDVERPLLRALLAGGAALALSSWLCAVRYLRALERPEDLVAVPGAVVGVALATAAAAVVLGPLVPLAGPLVPLWRTR